MPGFIVTVGNGLVIPAGKEPALSISELTGDGYQVSWRTCRKFQNDKMLLDNDRYVLLLEGVVVNNHLLVERYQAKDWQDCVEKMLSLQKDTFYKEFRGSFCGFVYDKADRRWLFFTDHIGDKQVLYARIGDGFVVGTEVQYLVETLKANGIRPTMDRDATYMALTLGYVIEDKTLFSEIHKLAAGHYWTLAEGRLEEVQYHRFTNKPKEMTVAEAVEGIDRLFREAVRLDFEKDREYGYKHWATLSGGLDSRMVVWVAHELGFTQQLNLTFSQSGYTDFKVAQKVASDLRHEFLFKFLDNGNCIYALDDVTAMTGGSACFFGIAHTWSLFNKLDYSDYGIVHTGELGDVIIATYQKATMSYDTKPSIDDGGYSTVLSGRLKDYVFKYPYENAEMYLMYNRGFDFVGQGTLGYDHRYTENLSPFCNVDFMEFCFSIPLKYRFKHKIYFDWVLDKYPGAANYIWTGNGSRIERIDNETRRRYMNVFGYQVPHFSDPGFSAYLKGFLLRRLGLRKKTKGKKEGKTLVIATKNNMNPVDYWYATNPELKAFMDGYWAANNALVPDPDIREDMRHLYEDTPATYDKLQVLSVLSAIKLCL